MRWYFSSRTRHEKQINYLINFLSKHKHEISFDWTSLGPLKLYEENKGPCLRASEEVSESIKDSDIFVMISDKEGTDMLIELGLAIGNNMEKHLPRVYVVGDYNQRSLMHHHPSIKHVKSIEDVFQRECPNLLLDKNFSQPNFE